MTITRIDISTHAVAIEPPFRPSWDSRPRTQFTATIVQIHDDSGHVGIGSGDTMPGFAGHEDLFIGQDPLALERHYHVLSHINFHYGRPWPVDLALWDLAGKITGQPVWKMLGGQADRVRLYASSGTLRDAGQMADLAFRYAEEGFDAFKLRLHSPAAGGGDWRDDLKRLETVKARVGERITVLVDCNQGWRMPWDTSGSWDFKTALTVGRELERLGVGWMEEPLHRNDMAGMRRLREALELPIAGAEMTRDPLILRQLVTEGCLDILQADVAIVEGFSGLRYLCILCADHGIRLTPHTWGNGIGLMANAHLLAGIGNGPWLELPYDPPEVAATWRDFMLTQPILPNGPAGEPASLLLGQAPGLGIALDQERLAATRIA